MSAFYSNPVLFLFNCTQLKKEKHRFSQPSARSQELACQPLRVRRSWHFHQKAHFHLINQKRLTSSSLRLRFVLASSSLRLRVVLASSSLRLRLGLTSSSLRLRFVSSWLRLGFVFASWGIVRESSEWEQRRAHPPTVAGAFAAAGCRRACDRKRESGRLGGGGRARRRALLWCPGDGELACLRCARFNSPILPNSGFCLFSVACCSFDIRAVYTAVYDRCSSRSAIFLVVFCRGLLVFGACGVSYWVSVGGLGPARAGLWATWAGL